MSNTQWTEEQLCAITEKNCNLLVAAAAGAGKTAVLVERIIRKITDEKEPVDIDKLLVVTFTNAAAAEMRERVGQAISKVLEQDTGSRQMQRQLALLGKASITTIHSFCLEVIRGNFQHLDIDPDFRIADETESSLMKMEALNELFEEQYEKEDSQEFLELLECYGGNRDDQMLMDMVLNLYNFIQSSPWPRHWLDEMTESLHVPSGSDFSQTLWGQVLTDSVILELEGLKEMMAHGVQMLKKAAGLEKYLVVFNEDLLNIENLLRLFKDTSTQPLWDLMFHELQSLGFATLPRASKEADKEIQETVKGIRDQVKKSIKKLCEKFVTSPSADIIADLGILYPKMKCLAGLVVGLSEKYAQKKSRKSVVDFNDLEHFCLEILSEKGEDGNIRPSKVALSYRERFNEILVDEYQDSNLVQEIIISMISRGESENPNVFMVGDVKQSIYRFRQARPELFLHKYNTYSARKGSPCRKILLYKNFRSRKNVVDAVNFIFKQVMSQKAGELDYTDEEALNPGAVFAENSSEDLVVGAETELHLMGTGNKEGAAFEETEEMPEQEEEPGEEEEILDKIQCEARLVAQRIHELLKPDSEGKYFAVYDKSKGKYRKAEYRDFVILLRTTKNWSEIFTDELALMGIPSFADTGSGFFKTIEVQVILSLLQIIDNPLQDIPLLSVLRSPIVSFSAGELAELRLIERKGPLYNALKRLALKSEKETSEKAAAFLERLAKWREWSLYLSTDQLIWQLYNDTGYYAMAGAMPFGEQRQANLRILFERARQFEETSYKGLFNFINFIDKLRSSRGDMGSAKILNENDNVVRIMSIHKSKGLEFPVVFLSGCGKKFNMQDMNKSILFHQDLGFGPDVVDHKLRLSWPSAPKQAIREKIKGETLSEEMRILYVALTRAREKLIITGSVNDVSKAVAGWMSMAGSPGERFPAYEMLKAKNYLDWICPALLRHKGCGELRQSASMGAEYKGLLLDDPSRWSVKRWDKTDVTMGKLSEESGESEFISWLEGLAKEKGDERLGEEIHRRLSWVYPYEKTAGIPAKVSVTELKRRFDPQKSDDSGNMSVYVADLIKKPLFLEEKKGLSAAERGTILHFIMQHLDLSFPVGVQNCHVTSSEIAKQTESMVTRNLITQKQAGSVNINKIALFFDSPLGRRMLAAKSINREVPFNMEIPCSELYTDLAGQGCNGETVLLQGVIDCYFEEPDGIVLIDYKTDYAPPNKQGLLRNRYKLQISYYVRALEMLTGKQVKEKYIYLFWNGEVLAM